MQDNDNKSASSKGSDKNAKKKVTQPPAAYRPLVKSKTLQAPDLPHLYESQTPKLANQMAAPLS